MTPVATVRIGSAFAVKGVFRYTRYRDHPHKRRKDVCYELRILRIEARDEDAALRLAHRLFAAEAIRSARAEADSVPEVLKVAYLGVARVLAFGDVGMQGDELWWEFQDERPSVSYRPRRRRRKKESASRSP